MIGKACSGIFRAVSGSRPSRGWGRGRGRAWAVALALAWAVAWASISVGCGGGSDTGVGSAREGGVVFVGFDANPELTRALRNGELRGLVLQNPLLMGEAGVRTLVAGLEGREHEGSISTGETLATPENMDDPSVSALLNPPKAEHSEDARLGPAKSKRWRVVVIPKGTSHEFWKTIHAGARKAAEDLGTVELSWQGPSRQDDVDQQIQLIQSAVAGGADGIVLAPADSRILVGPVEDAVSRGVRVVIIDSALESDKPAAYVATNNYNGGVLGARRLGEELGGKGRIILLRYPPGSAATREREKGFTDTIEAEFPGIEYLSKDQDGGPDDTTARQASQNLVTRFRGRIDGVFCPNESTTQGMLGALREAGLLRGR